MQDFHLADHRIRGDVLNPPRKTSGSACDMRSIFVTTAMSTSEGIGPTFSGKFMPLVPTFSTSSSNTISVLQMTVASAINGAGVPSCGCLG